MVRKGKMDPGFHPEPLSHAFNGLSTVILDIRKTEENTKYSHHIIVCRLRCNLQNRT